MYAHHRLLALLLLVGTLLTCAVHIKDADGLGCDLAKGFGCGAGQTCVEDQCVEPTGSDAGTDAGQAVFAVGTFTASAGGSQVVPHTLGGPPRAILLWSSGRTDSAVGGSWQWSTGISDGTTSRAVGATDVQLAPTAATQASTRFASALLTAVNGSGVLQYEAQLSAWNDQTLTLNWTTQSAAPVLIHYLLIGGGNVMAKVVDWDTPTSAGTRSVTGTGFVPDAVLHLNAGALAAGTLPLSGTDATWGMGWSARGSGQFAAGVFRANAQTGGANQGALRTQQGQDCVATVRRSPYVANLESQGACSSFDADGFSLSFAVAGGSPSPIASLALSGVRAAAGLFVQGSGLQSVGGVGFAPGAVLLASARLSASTTTWDGLFGMGAAAGAQEATSALRSQSGTTYSSSIDPTPGVFVLLNRNANVDAAASLSGFTADGFSLQWSATSATPPQVGYLALGAKP